MKRHGQRARQRVPKKVLSCWSARHLWSWRPVGKEGLVQFDLRPCALARQRFAASSRLSELVMD